MSTDEDRKETEEHNEAAAEEAETESSAAEEAESPAAAPKARAARAAARRPARRAPPPQGGLGKSFVLFALIVGGLGAAFYAMNGAATENGPAQPKWKKGQTADVEITLVAIDKKELACASGASVGEKKCAFDASKKPVAGADADDKKLLRPYTTTDGVQFLAAGLWSDPALSGSLPPIRFAVKCKYTVEDMVKKPAVRWQETGAWFDQPGEWFAGKVEGCALVK